MTEQLIQIGIFYFSGSGNTEPVAKSIRDHFTELGCRADLLRMEDIIKIGLHVDPDQYDYLGIGYPIIRFGVPPLVSGFISDFPKTEGKKTFLFHTAGGFAYNNCNASRSIIDDLTQKGYDVQYEKEFYIGCRWMVRLSERFAGRLRDSAYNMTERMCKEIYLTIDKSSKSF